MGTFRGVQQFCRCADVVPFELRAGGTDVLVARDHRLPVKKRCQNLGVLGHATHGDGAGCDPVDTRAPHSHASDGVVTGDEVVPKEGESTGRLCAAWLRERQDESQTEKEHPPFRQSW